jgi:putative ABC transport system permease protein
LHASILSILLQQEATDRAKEVGLRKVLGAVRKQLVSQFMMESILFATVASILSFGLVQILMPAYSNFIRLSITFFLE